MSRASARSTAGARIAIEIMLGALACWLVVQNTLLLALDPWAARPVALVATVAIVKAAGHVVAAMWPLVAVFSIIPGAIAVALFMRWIRWNSAYGQEATDA